MSILASSPVHLLTLDDVLALDAAGLLDAGAVELIDGVLYDKMASSSAHAAAVERLADLARAVLPADLQVRTEKPVQLSATSAPEPDIAVVRQSDDYYVDRHPTATDVVALIEVADSSLADDLGPKAERYVGAGITAYAVFDVRKNDLVRPASATELPAWLAGAFGE